MKDKILTFVIGLLLGAVITAGGFLIYINSSQNNNLGNRPNDMRMFDEQFKMDGEFPKNDENMPQIPQMPDRQWEENENNNQKTKNNDKNQDKQENKKQKTTTEESNI